VGNRMSPKEWGEAGRPMLLDAARARMEAVLKRAGSVIPDAVDAAVRARFDIRFQ
ncbi:MAG TPA: methyltransferase, partial [Paracoccaceae bacterium]|nr:methyltransferase [Paracoccaceae bacterium]